MADEFQAGICGGNRWNTSRSSFGTSPSPSPCSAVLSDMGSYGWSTDMMMDMKTRSTSDEDDDHSASVCDNSMVGFQDIIHKPHPVDSGGVLMDSTLQMLGFGLSPSSVTSDWNNNQTLLHGSERSESNYNSMLQEDMNISSRVNYRQEERRTVNSHQFQQTDWTSKNFAAIGDEDSSIVTSCQGLPTGSFPMGSANSYDYPSSIVQSLFEPDHESQPQQTVFDNYHSSTNFRITTSNEFIPSGPKLSPNFLKPSTPPKQQSANHLQFSNNTHFWNAASAAAAVNNDIRASFLSSQHSQFVNPTFEEKPIFANLTAKPNSELQVSMAKKSSNEPEFKRPRIETPSPLPTFKVRKEKLGDRITALQQLVSPFGKTDTASVLHEAIEYIKYLHDQVSVLSTPYMKNGAVQNVQHQQTSHKLTDSEGTKQDLRSRGLCLVPISSTYPVANETTADFWTPTFGGTFR